MNNAVNLTNINVTELSKAIAGHRQCKEGFKESYTEKIIDCIGLLPSGSGIDNGIKFLWDESTPEKIMFFFEFHHLNENGYYDGWTGHNIIITPSLQHDFNLKITGKNKNGIKDYLHDLFSDVFTIKSF